MLVGGNHLPQRGGVGPRLRIFFSDLIDHELKALDLGRKILSARLGALKAKAELEILFVAHQNICDGRDLVKGFAQLFLAALPERGAVVEVEADERAVFFCNFRNLKAALRGFLAHRGDQPRKVEDAHALFAEDAVEIEIVGTKRSADLAGAVVPHAGRSEPEAGIRDVELVSVAPGAALRHVLPLKTDVARPKLPLDKVRHRRALYKFRKHKALAAEAGRYVEHVALGGGRLQIKQVAVLHRHAVGRRDPEAHAGHRSDCVFFHNFHSFTYRRAGKPPFTGKL